MTSKAWYEGPSPSHESSRIAPPRFIFYVSGNRWNFSRILREGDHLDQDLTTHGPTTPRTMAGGQGNSMFHGTCFKFTQCFGSGWCCGCFGCLAWMWCTYHVRIRNTDPYVRIRNKDPYPYISVTTTLVWKRLTNLHMFCHIWRRNRVIDILSAYSLACKVAASVVTRLK